MGVLFVCIYLYKLKILIFTQLSELVRMTIVTAQINQYHLFHTLLQLLEPTSETITSTYSLTSLVYLRSFENHADFKENSEYQDHTLDVYSWPIDEGRQFFEKYSLLDVTTFRRTCLSFKHY